ncbi:MAG TPA: ferrous iron transport protein B [Ornithinibacter sp.]|uniref:ferrous iron transport protein B n=1 Tax=Actinotalea sp. TaxID=1872145 RepID=UPI002D1A0EA7|nr:ferrous iron transport protein B [Actinotalea sp.]HNV42309.1 ferrous iron transport protein B [Ornithinibacter sp.]HOT57174.1 ferrous iron transport protein B [Ornithinibacter sp.]HPV90397.1 ferrous iron transport protein B [Ornithinibacter sp.]HQG16541.1 ferrous iron transport protein B [Ornithinibacter sp.]HRA51842.1 ferrous iron transport protein B [Actinotalea sp.]
MSTSPPAPRSVAAPSCHEDAAAEQAPAGAPVVVLCGAPNVGKSTLFNALTGARRTVGNWPGTTVEVGRGACPLGARGAVADVVDLPGSYSLDPMSPDEALTREVVLAPPPGRPDVVVVVASAAHLARSLYLVAQVRETTLPVVVAVTMGDVAARRGIEVDAVALAAAVGCPVVAIDPRRRSGVDGLVETVSRQLGTADAVPRLASTADPAAGQDHDPAAGPVAAPATDGLDDLAAADERFAWIDTVVTASVRAVGRERRTWSDRIDRFATAPVIGPLLFLAVMWLVFQATTTLAAPLQDALDAFVSGPVSTAGGRLVDAVGLGDSPIRGLVVDGIIAGVGMLLTFVPLMALMFLLLALLEDSGYLARAAVVTDRLMGRLGLPGRAFLPLVVGFGCNVPAISATRILPNARHRVLTALLVPFTSCTARLTVYVLLATTFFPQQAGTVVFAMYLVSILLVVLVGLALRATLWRTVGSDPLVIDLPPYQRPTARLSLAATWLRLEGFLRTASGIIVATVVVVWLLQSIPVGSGSGAFGEVAVADSLYAELSRAVAPLLAPAGFGAWEAVSALLVGFVAKEAVISSWAQTFALAEPASSREPGALGAQLQQTFDVASGGHTGVAVMAFMVFLLAYTPCVATLAAQRRELGMRWTAFGVVLQLGVAWVLAVAVFQVGRVFW